MEWEERTVEGDEEKSVWARAVLVGEFGPGLGSTQPSDVVADTPLPAPVQKIVARILVNEHDGFS